MPSIFRSEAHALVTTPEIRADVERTVVAFRRAVRALCGVIMVHWPEVAKASFTCNAVEALFHATAKRPVVRYAVLGRMLGKMPSYLRRAAIEQAHGAVASYLANYGHFLDQNARQASSFRARKESAGTAGALGSLRFG